MLKMQIPYDYSLVPYLSPGNTQNNKGALLDWIKRNIDMKETITPAVISHAGAELMDYLQDATC